jgi:hypothetical protein
MKIYIISILILFSSCSSSVKPEDLYGRWNYIEVRNADPEEDLPEDELKIIKPAIIFNEDSTLIIEWEGKQLSEGKFRIEGKMIRYTENIDGGTTREFPFLIKKLTADELVFTTMERDFTEVRAKR